MKRLIPVATSVALMASVAVAIAEEIVIGAGGAKGEYTNTIVPAISAALNEHGMSAKAQVSAGSQQNMEDLMAGKLSVVLAQMDVAALNLRSVQSERYLVLGEIAPEALLCAVRKSGNVHTYHDLTDDHEPPLKVSVGPEGGGAARTFEFLMSLDGELRAIELIHKSSIPVELSRLASGNRAAVCFVMMPNPDNELIELVADNDQLEFMEFVSPPLAGVKVNGLDVYDFMEVPVTPGVWGWGAGKVKTLVTRVALVVDEQGLSPEALTALASVMLQSDLLPPTSVAGKANELWRRFRDEVAR